MENGGIDLSNPLLITNKLDTFSSVCCLCISEIMQKLLAELQQNVGGGREDEPRENSIRQNWIKIQKILIRGESLALAEDWETLHPDVGRIKQFSCLSSSVRTRDRR